MMLNDSVAVTNSGVYLPEPLFSRGLGDIHFFGESSISFDVSLDLMVILFVLGACIWGGNYTRNGLTEFKNRPGTRPTTWYLRLGIVAVPTIVLLSALELHFGFPELKGFNFKGGPHLRNSLIALWLALSLYTAAFIAEIVRAGIAMALGRQSDLMIVKFLRVGFIEFIWGVPLITLLIVASSLPKKA